MPQWSLGNVVSEPLRGASCPAKNRWSRKKERMDIGSQPTWPNPLSHQATHQGTVLHHWTRTRGSQPSSTVVCMEKLQVALPCQGGPLEMHPSGLSFPRWGPSKHDTSKGRERECSSRKGITDAELFPMMGSSSLKLPGQTGALTCELGCVFLTRACVK